MLQSGYGPVERRQQAQAEVFLQIVSGRNRSKLFAVFGFAGILLVPRVLLRMAADLRLLGLLLGRLS